MCAHTGGPWDKPKTDSEPGKQDNCPKEPWKKHPICSVVQSLSCVWLCVTPWTAARRASLSFNTSQSLLKLTSMESMVPSNQLIVCRPLLLLPSIFQVIQTTTRAQLRVHVYVCPHVPFLPLSDTLLASLLSLSVEIHLYTADGPGPGHWPLGV